MELTVRLVCRPQVASGFELAGLKVDLAADPPAAAAALAQLSSTRGVGLVLVEELLYRALPFELLGRLARQGLPVVAPFPGPRWDEQGAAEDVVLEILRRAVGYRVRAL